jgi:hypothetical protein
MFFSGSSVRPLLTAILAGLLFGAMITSAQQVLSVPSESPRWDLQGQAKATEYQGRKCLLLDGGAAVLKDFEMRDGVVDMEVATPAKRGFFGLQFRLDADGANVNGCICANTSPDFPTPCSTHQF